VNLAEPVIVERIRVELAGAVPSAVWDLPEAEPKSGPDILNDGKNTGHSPDGGQAGSTK
jgi:hypothetical protein